MSETDVIQVGEAMSVLAKVQALKGTSVAVEWAEGPRAGCREVIDLAPVIMTLKAYRPLRDNPALFGTMRVIRGGTALGWADCAGIDEDDIELDMSADTVERLAEEAMTSADFKDWLDRQRLTFDAAAAVLGISRRLVAYYASEREVPRYIALACAYLDRQAAAQEAA